MLLTDKIALITGAGSGIGRRICSSVASSPRRRRDQVGLIAQLRASSPGAYSMMLCDGFRFTSGRRYNG